MILATYTKHSAPVNYSRQILRLWRELHGVANVSLWAQINLAKSHTVNKLPVSAETRSRYQIAPLQKHF